MGEIKDFTPEKLVIGILISSREKRGSLIPVLEEHYGAVDYTSPELAFNYTDYYCPEMGGEIKRFFVSFSDLVSPERLPYIKKDTNSIEDSFRSGGQRKINLDPGLLSLNRFILATTKDNGHRIPLSGGIFAEITLMYMMKEFKALPWTYSDYRSPEYHEILKSIRKIYREDLKQRRG